MPTPNTPTDPAQNNADVAKKLADQDQSLKPSPPAELQATDAALDALAKEAEAKAKEAAAAPEPKADAPPVTPDPAKPDAPVTPVAPVEDPAKKRAEELFKDSPSLPTNASPRSSEAFSAVKIKAAQEVSKLESALAERDKKLAEMEAKLKDPVPPELAKEVEDLRQFRARLDVEADPKFKEFDKSIAQTQEFIYDQLRKNPAITEDTIAAIKKYGGPENVNLDKVFEAAKDPALKRIVDSAITDIEKAKFNKAEAIKSVKANIDQYIQERQKANEKSATMHTEATKQELNKIIPKLEWLQPKAIDEKADAETKKSLEAHNSFVSETNKSLESALHDDSPEMRAIMLTGMAQLLYLQRVHEAALAKSAALEKQVGELTKQIDGYKKASTSRLRESGAPPTPSSVPGVKPIDPFNTRAVDALDRIRDQVVEAHTKAAGQ
jgi:hypothetical protein